MIDEDSELLADCAEAVLDRHDPASWKHDIDETWHYVRPKGYFAREQGWKLHVPATPLSACVVLSRCVTVLATHRCAFKFAKSMRELQLLIEPNADLASAGKFLTAYPHDDEHALRVAGALHEATLGLPGQRILTDRRFRENSEVYYRYGAFTPRLVLTDDGEYAAVLRGADGSVVVDRRQLGRPAPEWVIDPFRAGGIIPPSVPDSVLLVDRYLVHSAIRQSNRGGVYVATDTETGTEVIIKRFRRHTAAAVDGTDSRNRARAEARLLDLLGPRGASPRFLNIFTAEGDMFVVAERIEGVSLRRFVARNLAPTATGGLAMDTTMVLDMAGQLVDLLAEVHAAGYVFSDLTPNNVMVGGGNRLVLIDLEAALRPWEVTTRLATRGYTAPEEESRIRLVAPAPAVPADLYGLGATLVYLASGVHPPMASGARFPAMIELMAARNPAIAALCPLLTALIDDDPDARPPLPTIRAALLTPRTAAPKAPELPAVDELIEDMIDEITETVTPGSPMLWPPSAAGRGYDPCAVHTGAAGVLTVLNQAIRLGRGNGLEATAELAARWIVRRLADEPRVLPGLLFGRAGTALALFEAGELLTDRDIGAAGLQLARRLPTSWPVPDVFHGQAGGGIALLSLWRSTGNPEFLERAQRCADGLLTSMHSAGHRVTWTATGDFSLAGKTHWGFAHGVAGIGAFLLDAATATGAERFLDAARRCVDTLVDVADRDGAAAFWPSGEPDERADSVRMTGFCSGASGVGSFLLRFFTATSDPMARELAGAAAVAVRCAQWAAPPVWCHGLASDGDFLLDCADVFGEPRYRDWAGEVADVIAARTVSHNGRQLTPDEGGNVVVGFGNGLAGPLSFLLRLRHGGDRLLLPRLQHSDRVAVPR